MSKKIVLITGCTIGGIGAALVERFAEEGCIVYATARRLNAMDGFQHPNIRTLSLDVTKEEQVHSVVDEVYQREGRIDVLVNNAGRAAFGMPPSNPVAFVLTQRRSCHRRPDRTGERDLRDQFLRYIASMPGGRPNHGEALKWTYH